MGRDEAEERGLNGVRGCLVGLFIMGALLLAVMALGWYFWGWLR